ncbi:hypothetical protein Y032_0202g1764 [Ancylostoma ceylanicum]|uniref:Superoxide dismutase [Cu-Zn] n=1 Tax=Ancylostoma ceylanicum TaxID=53326 RepID=A0A016SM91_9BILA|nr:hypothetical protein Y032_0202g1764 [Ancylostoma ceylanicum]
MKSSIITTAVLFFISTHGANSYYQRYQDWYGSYPVTFYVSSRDRLYCWIKNLLEKIIKQIETEWNQGASNRAVAVVRGDGINGTIWFTQDRETDPCLIQGVIQGLPPGHRGFHVHQYGDLSRGCISAGPHFNPFNKTHGGPMDRNRHTGDLGSIVVGADGVARFNITDYMVKIHGKNSVIGRAVVVHAGTDDLGRGTGHRRAESLRTGNAGARIACGVIGIAAPL